MYVFGRGYGHDTIQNTDTNRNKRDVLRLVGLTRGEVDFLVSGSNFIVRIKDTRETITIAGGAHTGSFLAAGIEAIEFGDGVMEWADIVAGQVVLVEGTDGDDSLSGGNFSATIYGGAGNDNLSGGSGHDVLYGGDGNDILYGRNGNDILDGGAGNDILDGGAGNDVFVFGRGYGYDIISGQDYNASKRDVLRLVGLTRDEVDFLVSGSHFIVRIKDTGETITAMYAAVSKSNGLEAIEFGDGQVMEWAEIAAGQVLVEGTDGDDRLSGGNFNATIYGGAGNDILTGGSSHDVLYGGDGDDSLSGGAGNDTLYGGAGNDALAGGAGDDTYIFNAGDGHDTIYNSGGGDDLLFFQDINPAELWFGKSGYHLNIGLVGTQDQVTVYNWYSTDAYKINTIQAGNDAITESQVAQLVQAMAAIGAPAGVDGQWTDEQREALAPVLATYWQPRV